MAKSHSSYKANTVVFGTAAVLLVLAHSCGARSAHIHRMVKPAATVLAVKPVVVLPVAEAAPGTVPLGVNLEGLADWMRTPMFVDAMRTSRVFGSADKPWDKPVPLDSLGNPTTDCGSCVITGLPHMDGVYHFSCLGRVEISTIASDATIANTVFDPATGRTTAEIIAKPTASQLILSFQHTNGGIKDIHLIRPGYPAETKQIFTNEFLAAIKPFSTLRLMDYLDTNETQVAHWADRNTPVSAQYTNGKGGALEDMIALANSTGKDLWVNVPDLADDDYLTHEAQLFHDTLKPGHHVYLENSNEVWNSQFGQNHRNQDSAEKEAADPNSLLRVVTGVQWDDANNKYYWGTKRVSQQLLKISRAWKAVYGPDAYARTVRPVLASQIVNTFLVKLQLGYIAKNFGPPANYIYGIAGAPYYNLSEDFAKRTDLTSDSVVGALAKSVDDQTAIESAYDKIASDAGVKCLAYEGGTDIKQDDQSLDAKIAANHDPRMKEVTEHYLNNWYGSGGGLFMYFTLCSDYNKWGAWGLTDDITNLHEPKYEGAVAVLAGPKPAAVTASR